MQISIEIAKEIFRLIEKAEKITIISHRNPDADTIGSNLALAYIIEKLSKKIHSACIDNIEEDLNFLKPGHTFQTTLNLAETDLIICVDIGSINQFAFGEIYPELFSGKISIINIDHHASNNGYGTINLIIPEAASTTIIIYWLLQIWKQKITPAIATCLLYGLYYDTGSFMHSNTNAEVYQTGGELLKLGADLKTIIKNLFHTHSIDQLKLWGKIFSEAELTDKKVVVAGIKTKDLIQYQTKKQNLSGAIDYLSMIKENMFAALLSEDDNGIIRGSLRTKKDDINLSEIAQLLNGGGHKKASGFSIKGKLKKEIRWSIKPNKN